MQQWNLKVLELLARHALQIADAVLLAGVYDAHANSTFAGTACTTASVHVHFRIVGKVKVHHVGELIYVESAGSHIGGHEQAHMPFSESAHYLVALLLRKVAVDGLRAISFSRKLLSNIGGLGAGTAKNDAVHVFVTSHDTAQCFKTVARLDHVVHVLNVGSAFIALAHTYFHRVLHVATRDVFHA